jgi:hypothetical protein
MTEEEQQQMTRYGITAEEKTVYRYRNYKYENLAEALNFARIDSERKNESDAKP